MPPSNHTHDQKKHVSQIQLELEALYKFYRCTTGEKGAWTCDSGWSTLVKAVEQTADTMLLRGPLDTQLELFGVTWERNHVKTIDLCANHLKGKLPKELAHLRYLKQLKLRNNPGLRGPVPVELLTMAHLQYCYIDGTRLENVLPHHSAHSFEIIQLHAHQQDRTIEKPQPAATIRFQTGDRETSQITHWMADMTDSAMFMVQTSLKARHEKPREPEVVIRCTASNATGPERVASAIKLQRIYRARIARSKFRQFLKSLYEKKIDITTGYEYYVDTRTGESMWERPKHVVNTPRGTGNNNTKEKEIWEVCDDGNGNKYYWNRETGESTWEPPVFLTRIYQQLRTRYPSATSDQERFDAFFNDIDKDQTGSIDQDEFARLCGELGMAMSPTQIQHVFIELDTSEDGELSREEIITWLTRNYND